MLNEFKEVDFYLNNLINDNGESYLSISLLIEKTKSKDGKLSFKFDMQRHIFTIIARRYIYHNWLDINKTKDCPIDITDRIAFLSCVKKKLIEYASIINKNSQLYRFFLAVAKKINMSADDTQKLLDWWEKDFDRRNYSEGQKGIYQISEKYTKTWYIDNVLADALEIGPLRNHKIPDLTQLKTDIIASNNKKGFRSKELISIIATTIAYLMTYNPENNFIEVPLMAILNKHKRSNDHDREKLKNATLTINGEPLTIFEPTSLPAFYGLTLYRINPALFKHITKYFEQ